jgi:hypothetical protein
VPIAIFANEVCAHPRTVRRWIARGNLPAFRRPGGDLLVDLADVDLVASGPAGRGLAMTGDVEHREQTPDQARELTNRIRDRLDGFVADLLTAWNGRADKVLGYTNWNA